MGRTWVCKTLWNKRMDFSVWVMPRLSWIFHNVPDLHVTCKCYGGCPKGGYWTVFCCWWKVIFSGAIVNFKGGQVMSLEEGRMSWNLDYPVRTTIPLPWLPPRCLGEVGRFGFAPRRYGGMKICFSYEGCEFWWVLMGWWVDVYGLLIGMLCIMGVRWVCFIVGMCTVDVRGEINRGVLQLGKQGLCGIDLDVIKEVT